MKKSDIYRLYHGLNSCVGLSGAKFNYAVAKNIRILQSEVEAIDAARKPSEDYQAYDKEREELAKSYALKDEKGEAIIENGQYKIIDQDAFDAALDVVKEKHKDAIAQREQQDKDFTALLESEADTIELHKVKLSDVPDAIEGRMFQIVDIIEE